MKRKLSSLGTHGAPAVSMELVVRRLAGDDVEPSGNGPEVTTRGGDPVLACKAVAFTCEAATEPRTRRESLLKL